MHLAGFVQKKNWTLWRHAIVEFLSFGSDYEEHANSLFPLAAQMLTVADVGARTVVSKPSTMPFGKADREHPLYPNTNVTSFAAGTALVPVGSVMKNGT